MKVVLLQDVRKLGERYEVKDVADGYARNFLIPKGLAKAATRQILNELRARKKVIEEQVEVLKRKAKEIEVAFQNNPLVFKLKFSEETAFGSVSREDIREKLKAFGSEEMEVNLEKPLKTAGSHEVAVDLGRGVKALIKVLIEKE